MSDITYKKFSELTRVDSLQTSDIIPIAQFVSGTNYNSRSIPLSTLYNQTSAALITPFTTSIQTTVNSALSSDKWNSTYSTVQTNSAAWSITITDTLTAFAQGDVTSPQLVRFLSAGTTGNASVAIIATGTGATLAQVPDNGIGGGNNRGSYATDWQKARNNAQQVASGINSVIGGGGRNTASSDYSVVNGGYTNSTSNTHTVIGGGLLNTLSGDAVYGVIAGGYNNIADKSSTAIGGGETNKALSAYATVPGGYQNVASGNASFAVGYSNTASGDNSSAIGSSNNTNRKQNAHIIGSNMTAPSANYTYVNNLSSPGTISTNIISSKQYLRTTNYSTSVGGGLISVYRSQGEVQFFKGNFTAATTIEIWGVDEPGSQIKIYLENTGATGRTITPQIVGEITPGSGYYLPLPMASSSTVGAAGITSFTLAANGRAVITANNMGGSTSPWLMTYIGSAQ
jgi:hypothetical protein